MSDTRSSFQVPASRTPGVSTDAGEAAPPDERGQAPIDPALDTGASTGEEEAPTARWPVPDYAEPPTGAWDRHRPPTGELAREPRWPVPDGTTAAGGTTSAAGTAAEDDPETFTFDRPVRDDRPAGQGPSTSSGPHNVPSSSGAHGSPWSSGPHNLPSSSSPHGSQAPASGDASDGFSYWQRPATQQAAPATPPGRPGPGTPASASASERRPAGHGQSPAGHGQRPGDEADEWDDSAPEEAPSAKPAKRPREPYLDNVKFLLIALVPAGHALVPTLSAHSSRSAYLFIYVFHMPLFVVISGYLSRNFWNSNAKTNKLVDTFLVPYVIVEVGYAVLRFALGHKWSLTIIDPAWLNWYLLALLLWRLSTPVWKRMRHPFPIAIAVYLLAGLSDLPGDFSMDRFFGLMPFFVLGLWMQPHHFEMLNRVWVKIVAVVVLVGAAGVAILIAPHVPLDPVYFKDSYAELHLSWWVGMGMRAGLLVAALAVSFAILALVPRRNTWFSDLGTRTLYCYLLHGIPVMIAKEMGWLSFPWLHGPLGVMAILSSAFALAIVLCLPETRTVFKWLLEPRLTWLYRRPSGQTKQATT
ncbi:acyltransferase family protein [Sphaerisporangium dianthi]|uniref:Acyltransferase family protein n=1 Tax=Sphaerisporangium dianthi TaxID=1436120 RepID=A0ABV9CET1_9ACTN